MKTQNFGAVLVDRLINASARRLVRGRGSAVNYKKQRGNGNEPVWFKTEFPHGEQIPDKFYSWRSPQGKRFPVERYPADKDYFLCPEEVRYKKEDGNWYADLRLDETPEMRECMERRDVEYIRRLRASGLLLEKEPNGDKEILQAECNEWHYEHQFHDEIFAAFAAARAEVEQFRKELSEPERLRIETLQGYRDAGLLKLAKENNSDGMQYLLSLADYDLNIHVTDAALRTALHYAAEQGTLELVQTFVEKGANVLAEDGLDQTARDIAKDKKHIQVAAFLKKAELAAKQKQFGSALTPATPPTPIRPAPFQQPDSGGGGAAEQESLVDYLIPADKLRLGLFMGDGGFGKVYRGLWGTVEVAIKRLHLKSLTERTEEALKQEAKIMAVLHHPNIIRFYGICLAPSCYSIVMELALKGSLYNVLQSQAELPWKMRYSIAMDVGAGLSHLHEKNIIHRDLKSLNVLLDGNMRAQLTDFGLAQVKIETKTKTSQAPKSVGTRPWMAPELFGIRPQYSFQSDMYAYGMTLWEIAAREIPYAGVDDQEIKEAVKAGEREKIPEECPKGFAQLIVFCWAQHAQERPTAEQVVLELEGISAGQEATAAGPVRPGVSTLFREVHADLAEIKDGVGAANRELNAQEELRRQAMEMDL